MPKQSNKLSAISRLPRQAAWLILVCFACTPSGFTQQQNVEAPTFTLRTTVRRVIVDVVVTDSKGKPVPALKASDFSLTEDGKPQRTLSFDAHGFNGAMDYTPQSVPPGPPNTFINLPSSPERGPLNVLLLDLVNTAPDDQIFARKQLRRFVEEKPEGARFAIFVFSDGLHLVQGFTSDKQQLLSAVDTKQSRRHIPMVFLLGNNFGQGDPKTMQEVFAFIGRYLDGLPGRKNLMWISGNFPLALFASDNEVESYQAKTRQMLDLLAQDQIAVYPVDAQGVVVDEVYAPSGSTSAEGGGINADARSASAPGSAGGHSAAGGSNGVGQSSAPGGSERSGEGFSQTNANYGVAREVAEITGGHAFVSTNDMHDALLEATEDGTSYYTLSYAPSNAEYNGKLRQIHVALEGKGYHLAYRRAYYGTDPEHTPGSPAASLIATSLDQPEVRQRGDSLSANMEHGAPMAHQLVFGAHVHALAGPKPGTPEQMASLSEVQSFSGHRARRERLRTLKPVALEPIAIDYAVIARQFGSPGPGAAPPSIEVAAAAYDADGRILNASVSQTVETSDAVTPGSAGSRAVYRIKQVLNVPAEAASLRMAMRDVRTDRVGALEVKLPLAPETQATTAAPAGTTP